MAESWEEAPAPASVPESSPAPAAGAAVPASVSSEVSSAQLSFVAGESSPKAARRRDAAIARATVEPTRWSFKVLPSLGLRSQGCTRTGYLRSPAWWRRCQLPCTLGRRRDPIGRAGLTRRERRLNLAHTLCGVRHGQRGSDAQ